MLGLFKKIYDSYQYWSETISGIFFRQVYSDADKAIQVMHHDITHYNSKDFVKKVCGGAGFAYGGYTAGYWLGTVLIGLPCFILVPTPLSPFISPILYSVGGTALGTITMRFSAQLGYAQGDHLINWLGSYISSPDFQGKLKSVQQQALENVTPMILNAYQSREQKPLALMPSLTGSGKQTPEWLNIIQRRPQPPSEKKPIGWGSIPLH